MYYQANLKKYITIIFFALQLFIIVSLIITQKSDYIRDVIFITTIAALYILLEAKYSILVNNFIRLCLTIVILVHEIAGKIFDLYLISATFDKYLHAFGIYSLVLFVYTIMKQFTKMDFKSWLNKFIFLVLVGISLGAIFEILEFLADTIITQKLPNQPNLLDTDLDLIADVVGALIAALHICFISRKHGDGSPASN